VFCVTMLLLGMFVSIPPRATTYRLLDSSFSLLPPSRRLRCCSKPTIFDDLNTTAMKQDEAMANGLHSSTMTCSGDNKNYEYLEQGSGLVIIVLAKYLAGIYQSSPLPLISPISDAIQSQRRTVDGHHQPPVDIRTDSRGAHPIRTETSTMSTAAMRHTVSIVFSSASGLITTVIHIHFLQPIHSSPPPSRWSN